MLFAFAYVRAVSSAPLIVYAALVTSVPPLMYVNAGAISTSKSRDDADDDEQLEQGKSVEAFQ